VSELRVYVPYRALIAYVLRAVVLTTAIIQFIASLPNINFLDTFPSLAEKRSINMERSDFLAFYIKQKTLPHPLNTVGIKRRISADKGHIFYF
jgi:hypothetical protein